MVTCITWDWKEQPPLEKILKAAQEILTEAGTFFFAQPETDGDYYAIILSDRELSEDEIDEALQGESLSWGIRYLELRFVLRKWWQSRFVRQKDFIEWSELAAEEWADLHLPHYRRSL